MSQTLHAPVFPCNKYTFQGAAPDEPMEDKVYKLVHADNAGDVTATWSDGTTSTFTLATGEDVSLVRAVSVTSAMSVKIS